MEKFKSHLVCPEELRTTEMMDHWDFHQKCHLEAFGFSFHTNLKLKCSYNSMAFEQICKLLVSKINLKYDQELCRVKTFFDAISALFA